MEVPEITPDRALEMFHAGGKSLSPEERMRIQETLQQEREERQKCREEWQEHSSGMIALNAQRQDAQAKILESLLDDEDMLPDFKGFLILKGIPLDDERVPLLKEVWNQAIGLGSQSMIRAEGTDWGFKSKFVL